MMMSKLKKKLSVVQVVTRMNTGGVAVLVSDLVLEMDSMNFDVTLVRGVCQAGEEDYLLAREIKVGEVVISSLKRSLSPVMDLISFVRIAKVIRRLKPDIVHTHTSKAGLLGRVAARVFSPRSKVVHTYHGHLLHGYFSKIATAVLVSTEKSLARISDVLITMGNEVKENLVQVGIGAPEQFVVAFPGVKVKKPNLVNTEVLKFKSKHDDEVIFTFVGRLSPIKRCDRIIHLAKALETHSSKVHFLIIGDGELRKSLEEESIGLPITFVGWQSNTEDWLAVTDAGILLSDNEAVPLAMIEAGLAGLPLIATNVGSMSDVVIDKVNGYLVETNMDDIIEKVLLIANDSSLRELMGVKGRELAIENFSVGAMISKHEQIYSQMMSRAN